MTTPRKASFLLSQFLALAQLYSDQLGRRWKQLIAYHFERGTHHGRPPLGYRRELRDGRVSGPLLVDPTTAPAVREAFLRAAEGWPIIDVAVGMRRRLPRRSLSVRQVRRVLDNPVYTGQVKLGEQWRQGNHEPLVELDVFDLVRAHKRRAPPRRSREVSHSLVGLVYCARCRRHLEFHADRLHCPGLGDFKDCAGVGRPPVAAVEAYVLATVRARLQGRTVQSQPSIRRRVGSVDVGRQRIELAKIQEARGENALNLAKHVIDVNAFRLADEILAKEEAHLQAALDDAAVAPLPGAAADAAEGLLARWGAMTTAERNRAFRIIVRGVWVTRADYYRQPVSERTVVKTLLDDDAS